MALLYVLGVALLILKLAGVIAWAWWIVLIPFYPVAFGIAVLLFCCGFGLLMTALAAIGAFFGRRANNRRF